MEPPLPVAAPVPAAGSGDGPQPAPSCASTNWTVRSGSLRDAISFETSASILEEGGGEGGVDEDDGAVSVSGGLLLTRPADKESAPCEITICFRERHEIHRIYVRSTARVYEIYYASEWQGRDNEYLCTVRCGASDKEVFLPRCDNAEAPLDPLNDSSPSWEVHGKMIKGDSNTGEEDGWVEVKIPGSPLLGVRSHAFSENQHGTVGANSQICYEATADISDATPCTSLVLRLLSLQTKDCIQIEEVYIYADPVESTDSGSPGSMTGCLTGNSLLAMLVPSMLQLSKAENSRIKERTVSSNPPVQKHEVDASIITDEMDPKMAKPGLQTARTSVLEKEQILAARPGLQTTCTSVLEKEQIVAPNVLKERIMTVDSDVPGQHHMPEPVPEKGGTTDGRLGKILDELVLRVGRMEASLSRFEENMLKPLNCIDTRLQRVEQQLDALSSRSAYSKPFHCSRISAPEFQFDDCDSDGGFDIADLDEEDATVDSPDVVKEDATINSPVVVEEDATIDGRNMVEDMPASSTVSSAAVGVTFVPASDMCPGLFIKAPDFMNEDDEHVGSNDISESAGTPCPQTKASLSIDDALSSALRAFMLSTSINTPKNDIASFPESQSSNITIGKPLLDENVRACETSQISGYNETNRACSVNVHPRSGITFEVGEGQGMCHQKWQWDGFGGLPVDDVSEIDENENGSGKQIDDDSSIDEAPSEVPNLMSICRIWNEDSSSDSNIDENVVESHHNMDLLDENSTDSENEAYTLRNWLYGHQDDHRFKEASFLGATNCNDTNTEVGEESVRCNQNPSKVEIQKTLNSPQIDTNTEASDKSLSFSQNTSKVEIQMALNSSQDDELRDVQQILDPPMNEVSSLLDVQFVRHEKSNYAFQLDGLMKSTLDSEIEGNDWLNDVDVGEHSHSLLLEIGEVDAPVTVDDPLVKLEEVAVKSNDFSTEGSSNQQLFSSLI